jgi:hypothetical protein
MVKMLVMGVSLISTAAWAATTVDAAHPYAYGSNIGWLNVRGDVTNGAAFGYSYCTGCLWSANCGWISLGNAPTNGWQYSNASATDWGVNHDGEGRLTGYAYGENIGWLTFEQTYGQPRIDLRSGILSGFVWGANVGWVSVSNTMAYVCTSLVAAPDSDNDALPDDFEYRHTGRLTLLDGRYGTDSDSDGVTDLDAFCVVRLSRDSLNDTVSWKARPTRFYVLEATPSLEPGSLSWEDVGGGLLGLFNEPEAELTIGSVLQPSRFYRVRAFRPLTVH